MFLLNGQEFKLDNSVTACNAAYNIMRYTEKQIERYFKVIDDALYYGNTKIGVLA